MPLIKDGCLADDPWIRVGGEAPIPRDGDVVFDAERLANEGKMAGHEGRIGVELANDEDPSMLTLSIKKLSLIVLDFPAFTDGRAYSQAKVLREQLGYQGELRATGNVLADQAAFMLRCGFDTFEVCGRQDLATWERAVQSVSRVYQAGYQRGRIGLIGRNNS